MLDLVIAAIAGFVSFISPCVLPLVPAYIGYMGGRMTYTVSAQVGGAAALKPNWTMRLSTFIHGLAFVAGFTLVFTGFGILGTAFVQQFGSTSYAEAMIGRIGGIVIIFFGLHFMGALSPMFKWLREHPTLLNPLTSVIVGVALTAIVAWGFTDGLNPLGNSDAPGWSVSIALVLIALIWLGLGLGQAFTQPVIFWTKTFNTLDYAFYADTRRQLTAQGDRGLSGSALMGIVFAAGWTPCIGPTLGLAFTMAANSAGIGQAALLMTAYSLGLGIPFLLTALALDSAQGIMRGMKRQLPVIKVVSGAFLVVIGFMIASGRLQDLSARFSTEFGDFSYRLEQCTGGILEGDIRAGQYGACVSGERDFTDLRAENLGEAAQPQVNRLELGSTVPGTITGLAEQAPPRVGLAVGNLAPDFTTLTSAGEQVTLSDYRGQVVLLNFWFTWCEPCRHEMPAFEQAFQEHAADGFVVIGVNREESPEAIRAFAEQIGATFPLLLDEDSDIQDLYNISGYPSTFILDRNGVIIARPFGALSDEQIQALVLDALALQ